MKSVTEILEDIKKYDDIPEGYELLEIYVFMNLKRIILMYQNNQLNKEQAQKLKEKITLEYQTKQKEYEFKQSLFQKHVENIKKTESLRTKLRKKLNSKCATDTDMAETLTICIELIQLYSGEEFI